MKLKTLLQTNLSYDNDTQITLSFYGSEISLTMTPLEMSYFSNREVLCFHDNQITLVPTKSMLKGLH